MRKKKLIKAQGNEGKFLWKIIGMERVINFKMFERYMDKTAASAKQRICRFLWGIFIVKLFIQLMKILWKYFGLFLKVL